MLEERLTADIFRMDCFEVLYDATCLGYGLSGGLAVQFFFGDWDIPDDMNSYELI